MMRCRPLGHDETRPQEPDPVRRLAAAVVLQALRDARDGYRGEGYGMTDQGAMTWLQYSGRGLLNAFGADVNDVMDYITAPKNQNKNKYHSRRKAITQEPPP